MRRRLLALALVFTALLMVALAVPPLAEYAQGRASDLHQERLAAATRFATLADDLGEPAELQALDADLQRFAEVTGAAVWVLDGDDAVVASSGADPAALDEPAVAAAARAALDGSSSSPPSGLWPWQSGDLVVATPVGRDAQVLGAVVIVEDPARGREAVARRIALIAGAGLVVLGLVAWLVATPLVRWIVRPVEDLEDSVQRFADGQRSPEARVEGPPELRRLVATFNAMVGTVERSQQQQRDLVADVSHQLANPLTALRLRLESLVARGEESVLPVLAETERMSRALEAMIEIGRAGGSDRTRVPVDVAAQARERVELWQPLFGERLRVDLPAASAPAVAEDDLVATVVDALLDNAAKYAPEGIVEVALRSTVLRSTVLRSTGLPDGAPGWLLEVRDHGVEVSDAEASGLGGRFHRLKRHADVEGTGLGLAIVSARVHDAGGSVEIAAAHPGLRVRVTLPAGRDRGSSAATPGAARPAG